MRSSFEGRAVRVLISLALILLTIAPVLPAQGAQQEPLRPRIVWKPIPFPFERKVAMQSYASRHYGLDRWRLKRPRVVVEHYTASNSFDSTFATFSADVPDPELHERPGICTHFLIDLDGTIYQLVSLSLMCRHTVGLNYTAIGIEHVGNSDQQILSNPKQLRSSLVLTAWLMGRFGIRLADVIGHNESRTSRFHKELYEQWRCQTHGDFTKSSMDVYRARLRDVASKLRVPLGGPVRTVTPKC